MTEEIEHSISMRMLWRYLTLQGIDFEAGDLIGDALLARSRSQAGTLFLQSDCDVIWITDSDIGFRPEDVVKLCEEALEYDIIGAMYITRQGNHGPTTRLMQNSPAIFTPDAKPIEVDYLATGFMAISRRVFETLAKDPELPLCYKRQAEGDFSFRPFFMPFIHNMDGLTVMLSEDWAFCERAKRAGFKCYLDPSIRLAHYGNYEWTLEDMVRPAKLEWGTPLMLERTDVGKYEVSVEEATAQEQGLPVLT